ncbi:SixA phosphatase family protein [Aquimarina pacifica]|uniref:SixA phosphatase family protein n=1 Tax=Aquimarina pacifica TaxID=1296415 RepID=UPI000470B82E|nr:histidine phosphatase family protein [Aquimarina pacifica]
MKTLYMMRHAKSSWDFDVPDDKRPLNQRGLNDADLIGKELVSLIKPIDKVLCSPAERAMSTAEIVLNHLNVSKDRFAVENELYDFDGNQVMDVVKNCDDSIQTLMIFGHNHAFTSITNFFGDKRIDNLPTAGFVEIAFNVEHWKNISVGKTLSLIYPKLVR